MSTFEDREIKHVVVLIAMEAEGKPLIEGMNLQKVESQNKVSQCVVYQGEYHGGVLSVVLNGKDHRYEIDNVGTTPAAISAFVALTELQPDIVINAGTAGGFQRKGAKIGDAFVSTIFRHHDRRIPLPGFEDYGKSHIPSFICSHLVENLGYKSGVVTTSNSLDHCEMDDKVMLENDASVKDMEAASIAWVMELNKTPFFAVKVVTDIVDGDRPTHEEFLENLAAASKSLQEKLPKIVEFVMGKRLSDL